MLLLARLSVFGVCELGRCLQSSGKFAWNGVVSDKTDGEKAKAFWRFGWCLFFLAVTMQQAAKLR